MAWQQDNIKPNMIIFINCCGILENKLKGKTGTKWMNHFY